MTKKIGTTHKTRTELKPISIDPKKMYMKKHLRRYLHQLGIPSSRPTILSYEQKGLIPVPKHDDIMGGFERKWAMYTGAEIIQIGESLKRKLTGKEATFNEKDN